MSSQIQYSRFSLTKKKKKYRGNGIPAAVENILKSGSFIWKKSKIKINYNKKKKKKKKEFLTDQIILSLFFFFFFLRLAIYNQVSL